MAGRHRRKVPVARRLAKYGLLVSALTVLLLAYLSQPVATSNSMAMTTPPLVDVVVPDSPMSTTPSPNPTTKIKKPQRLAQQGLRSNLPKIEKDQAVTPVDPPSIKSERTSARPSRQDPVRSTTPTAGKVRSSSVPQRVTKEDIPKPIVVKTPPKIVEKAAVKITPTVTPRVVSSNPSRVSASPKKPKPQTVIAPPPPVPVSTSNGKCGSIGLLPTPKAACNQILAAFPEIKSVLGVGGRAGNPNSCHPKGLAIDFIVGTSKALGDRLYAYVIARRSALGATPVVLWQVPDHFDHVHVSFSPCKG
jgi:hypothetical protein